MKFMNPTDRHLRGSTCSREAHGWQTGSEYTLGRFPGRFSVQMCVISRSFAPTNCLAQHGNPTPGTTVVATGGCIVPSIRHSAVSPTTATIPRQMAVIMRHFKGQYDKWTKERVKHFPILEIARCTPLVARCYPTQRFAGDPDVEITNSRVVNHEKRRIYEEDRGGLPRVEDLMLA